MRKLVIAVACVVAAALAFGWRTFLPAAVSPRVVVLGVDGMDPSLAQGWMREGRLPHLAALAKRGGFYRLQSIDSPDCSAAWLSLASGRQQRTPTVTFQPAELLLNFVPTADERWKTSYTGTSLWSVAGEAGVRVSVIGVPGTFPPESLPNGELLAGLPLPDIRRTQGTYHLFGTTVSSEDEGVTPHGGFLRRLQFTHRVARATLLGPLHPVSRDELTVPITITWNHETRSANVEIGAHAVHLREREWSRWLELDFAVNAMTTVSGMAQLFLIRAGTEFELYVSPVHWHPASPPAAISSPPSFARDLYDRLGLFRTWGWNAATAALADERLDEAAFLDDVDRAFQDRAETILNRLDAGEWDILFGVVEAVDRVQHMMWRLTDRRHPRYDAELARRYAASIEQSYQQADELLGEILERVATTPDVLVMVISDHGFHTARSNSKWSGDHTIADATAIAGLLATSEPITAEHARLIDIAPTLLKYVGLTAPPDYAGRPLF